MRLHIELQPIPEQRWPKELLIFVVGFHAYLVTGSGAAREQAYYSTVIALESYSTLVLGTVAEKLTSQALVYKNK